MTQAKEEAKKSAQQMYTDLDKQWEQRLFPLLRRLINRPDASRQTLMNVSAYLECAFDSNLKLKTNISEYDKSLILAFKSSNSFYKYPQSANDIREVIPNYHLFKVF